MFKQTGHAEFNISKHQPWWIFLPSFKIIQLLNSGHSFFLLDHKSSDVPCCGFINISANYVAKCWPILLHFRLGNRSSCCFIYIHPVLRKNGKEHPLARAYTLFCIFNFDLFVFMLLASPNWKHVQHLYRIGFVALFGSLGCLAIFLNQQQHGHASQYQPLTTAIFE